MFVLVTVPIFAEAVLRSETYPIVGGGLITAYYLLQFLQEQTSWSVVGIVIGILFGGNGFYSRFRTQERERGE